MQKGKCPSCGATIGGEDHVNVKGVREISYTTISFNEKGYGYLEGESVTYLTSITTSFLRLITNISLYMASFLPQRAGLLELLHLPQLDDVRKRILNGTSYYFKELLIIKSYNLPNTCIFIMSSLYHLSSQSNFLSEPHGWTSLGLVRQIEQIANGVLPLIHSDIDMVIQKEITKSYQMSLQIEALKSAFGTNDWEKITTQSQSFWEYTAPISFSHFLATIPNEQSFRRRYSLLNAFLDQEDRLQYIQCIIPILKWHQILFNVFQNNELSREEAGQITNLDAVERLPCAERPNGHRILNEFCEAFNRSFHLVDNLFECEPNPFLTPTKQVDLSGSGKSCNPMSPNTIILFSIPAMNRGENVAASLCTIQLLLYLHRIHEAVLRINEDDHNDERVLPEISIESPPDLLRRYLFIYDRKSNLIPLLSKSSSYHSQENRVSYDLDRIQNDIRSTVFAGKESVRLNIIHYEYRGGLRTNGLLSRLRQRVPQESVSVQILRLIEMEYDTQTRITPILIRLEIIIRFLATVGGEAVRGIDMTQSLLRYLNKYTQILTLHNILTQLIQ
jgi:hypothetical protein